MGPYYSREHPASDFMARVVGKNATVTFEVISNDQETEQLLLQTLTNMVGGLLKQDKDRLKAALSTSPLPKQKPTSEAPEIKYAKERLEAPELIALGGKWAYSVGLVSDETSKSVRIAKGTIKGAFYRDKQTNEMVLKPDDKMHPISEVNKINVKGLDEWSRLQKPVTERLKLIEESKK